MMAHRDRGRDACRESRVDRESRAEKERERERKNEKGVLSSRVGACGAGTRIRHTSTYALHPLGTRPLFMLDIIPLSQNMHTSLRFS